MISLLNSVIETKNNLFLTVKKHQQNARKNNKMLEKTMYFKRMNTSLG